MGTWSTIWWTALASSGGAGAAGAAWCAWTWWKGRRSTERRICPGPPPHPLGRLLPHRWFLRGGCGYPLAGLPATPFGTRCPECGHRSHPRQWVAERGGARGRGRRGVRGGRGGALGNVRWGRVAAALLAAWIGVLCLPAVRTGRWPAYAPTWSLAAAQWAWPRVTGRPLPVRLERILDERIASGGVTGWSAEVTAAVLRRDLRADGVPQNATRAAPLLTHLGPAGEAALRASLRSVDYQERQQAARQLRRRPDAVVCHDLLRATVEGVGSDGDYLGRRFNYMEGVGFLTKHAVQARDVLEDGVASDDLQRRVLCATVLARTGLSLDLAVPVLVESLRERGYIKWRAMNAFRECGADIRSLVAGALQESEARREPDPQQRELVSQVLKALDEQAERALAWPSIFTR